MFQFSTTQVLREERASYLRAARSASLPSVRAFFEGEADRLAQQIRTAETAESRHGDLSRFASRCF